MILTTTSTTTPIIRRIPRDESAWRVFRLRDDQRRRRRARGRQIRDSAAAAPRTQAAQYTGPSVNRISAIQSTWLAPGTHADDRPGFQPGGQSRVGIEFHGQPQILAFVSQLDNNDVRLDLHSLGLGGFATAQQLQGADLPLI